jgi:hypothetical protein
MANTELRVKLLEETDRIEKEKHIREFFDYVKTYAGKDIYKSFLYGHKATILKVTRFKAIPYLERAIEKKFY